jgi:hypothetical protein
MSRSTWQRLAELKAELHSASEPHSRYRRPDLKQTRSDGSQRGESRLLRGIGRLGDSHDYDLAIADHIFAIFAAVTFAIYDVKWIQTYPLIISSIIAPVAVTLIVILFAVNQRNVWWRWLHYIIALAAAVTTESAAIYTSSHDLAPSAHALAALPLGVAVWISIRELAVVAMNCGIGGPMGKGTKDATRGIDD